MAEYIDREAFVAQKRELYCKDCDRRKGMKNGKYRILYDIGDVPCRACGIEDVLSDVEDFPAEDVQPVKHGRWIDGDCRCVTAVCSNCNRLRLGNGAKSAMRLALYCEKCGARMDGET